MKIKREPQNDLRYIKTESLIQETFRDMLREMDFTQVTIKDLTDRALINRKTFYLHYNSLDELLGRLQAELYSELLQSTADLKLPQDLEQLIRELFLFFAKTDDINEKILCSQGNFPAGKSPRDHAIKTMLHYCPPDSSSSKCNLLESNIINAYLNGSMLFIYAQWIADGRRIPLEELIQLTTRIISQGISTLSLSD